MKKIFSLAVMAMFAVAMTMMVSCGKDDSNNNENNQTSPIVGTWEYHETTFGGIRYYTETMSFKADGTMSLWFTCYDTYEDNSTWHYGKSLAGSYTIDGNKLNLTLRQNGLFNSEDSEFTYYEPDMSEPAIEFEFTYEISGDTLRVDKGDHAIFGHGAGPGVTEYIRK